MRLNALTGQQQDTQNHSESQNCNLHVQLQHQLTSTVYSTGNTGTTSQQLFALQSDMITARTENQHNGTKRTKQCTALVNKYINENTCVPYR